MSNPFWCIIMGLINVLKLCSGLAFFLYGMNVMSNSLMNIAGERINCMLRSIASDKLAAVILGTLVTAVVQSSSAVTVMTVGLVEAGIITLSDSIPIIMGANVGTTITSWLFAAAGISNNSGWAVLIKPENLVSIPALIGVIVIIISHKEKYTETGKSVLGFAILIYGMEMMTAAVSPLAHMSQFGTILTLCNNPLYGIMAGTILTAIIQSSSASVGILQALCISGDITYEAAVPIILGQNIGTCVTTVLAAIGTSANGKRTAIIHLYFNILGAVIFMGLFYFVRYMKMFDINEGYASASGIALVHSIFNIVSVVVVYPFSDYFAKIAEVTIRDN